MLENKVELEEVVAASEGIQAALLDATWETGADRTIEGSSDLRCKLQLAGKAQYCVGNSSETLSADSKLTFLYKPVGAFKRELISPGTFERSITLVFPCLEESLAGYTREDAAVNKVLGSLKGDVVMRRFQTSATTWRIAASILAMDRSSRSFDRLRRSRIDELACIVLDMFLESFLDERQASLSARERRQIGDAHDLLMANLANPPSLAVLAASVGTNRTKLNQGFNEIFGAPVYQLLHQRRMAAARSWIEGQGRSVSEVAEACGYEHVSNFSNAFKAYHGRTPSSLRQR
jgi:AraC-like DNA-binding protein